MNEPEQTRQHAESHPADQSPFNAMEITRPEPVLWTYYMVVSFLTIVAWPILLPIHYAKYRTLKYRFDDEGISMSWGFLFKREINLTYRRIQDIHVTRGLIQRWLKLATVSIQTASASSAPEMKIEGITRADELRDFLYSKMRGARGEDDEYGKAGDDEESPADEALELLREIRDQLAAQRSEREGHSS